jgi:hypothetical protein
MTASTAFDAPVGPGWNESTVIFNDTARWRLGGGAQSIADVLAHVTQFAIRSEYLVGDAESGLAKVELFAADKVPGATSEYAAEHIWETYFNDRYGTAIEYPADLFTPLPPPSNNDGRSFESADGRAGFYVFSQYNALEQSLRELFDADLTANADEQVTYKKHGDGWFVVSGYRDADIFYRKTLLSADGLLRVFEVRYRSELKEEFDVIVPRMAGSLTGTDAPNAGGAVDVGQGGPSGTYSTPWGEMTFTTEPDGSVWSDYEGGNSHITGQMQGTKLVGRWNEPSSNQRCSDGKYWGLLELSFTPDFGTFDGYWNYCDKTSERGVNGQRTSLAGTASPQEIGSSTPLPPASFGPFSTPARGTAERSAIMDAARGPVANDIGQAVIFVVSVLRSDGHWAYLQATPIQPNGSALNWNKTNFAADWRADAMSDTVMVLLSNDGGDWHVVDHVIGPTDVYWYTWIDQYQLPDALFQG